MEEKQEQVEDVESASSDSYIADSDVDEPSTSGQDDGMHLDVRHWRCFPILILSFLLPPSHMESNIFYHLTHLILTWRASNSHSESLNWLMEVPTTILGHKQYGIAE